MDLMHRLSMNDRAIVGHRMKPLQRDSRTDEGGVEETDYTAKPHKITAQITPASVL